MNIKQPWLALIITLVLCGCSGHVSPQPAATTQPMDESREVDLHWLEGSAPAVDEGVSWGVPWPEGKIQKETTFEMTDVRGDDVALQAWPLAYWPDGSIKWTGFAAAGTSDEGNSLKLMPGGTPAAPRAPIVVNQSDTTIEVVNGQSIWRIGRTGEHIVESISLGNRVVAENGRLIGQVEDRSDWDTKHVLVMQDFSSEIASATVEQSGPVRAVVKIEGKHRFAQSNRTWLPFVVRLYFCAGSESVRMVHTFIFDGDQEKDFIRGLGVRFDIPMREEFQNRHVRLAGDQGLFAEPVRLIAGRRDPNPGMYQRQIEGERIPNLNRLPAVENVRQMAVWDSYKLTQLTPDGFTIQKRTNSKERLDQCGGG